MKKMLKTIADYQKNLIIGLKEKNLAMNVSSVAGMNLSGDISTEEYKKIVDNLDGFTKEWKSLKEDSSKIVIEKNLFCNILQKIGGHFIFRGLDSENKFIVNTHREFKEKATNNYGTGESGFIIFLCFFIACMIAGLTESWIIFLVEMIIILIIYILWRIYSLKPLEEWRKRVSKNVSPNEIFTSIISKPWDWMSYAEIGLNLEVQIENPDDYSDCGVAEQDEALNKIKMITRYYHLMIREMMMLSFKFNCKGKVGWLWNYKNNSINKDSLILEPWHSTTGNKLTLKNRANHLLPVIETTYSFIFHFPNEKCDVFDYEDEFYQAKIDEIFTESDERLFLPFEDLQE